MFGYVYKIYSIFNPSMVYIGSTTQSLPKRFENHRYKYKNNLPNVCKVKEIFNKYHVLSCVIELLEKIEFNDKKELRIKEQEFMNKYNCVNRYKAFIKNRSVCDAEYRLNNKSKIHEQIKCNICNNMYSKNNKIRHQKSKFCLSCQ
jgi:hypothetical protein